MIFPKVFTRMLSSSTRSSCAKFKSTVDSECANYITKKSEGWPVHLNQTEKYGNGLFASRLLKRGEIVLKETPMLMTNASAQASSFDSNHPSQDKLVLKIGSQVPIEWKTDASLVAQALSMASRDPIWKLSGEKPSHFMLGLRCLGYTELQDPIGGGFVNADGAFVKGYLFQLLTREFKLLKLPESMWNPSECMLLYDKIKSNYFESCSGASVFEACSMLNHSCRPNVMFNPLKPDELLAVRDVPEGEQFFISYDVPAEYLPELYGFRCACEICVNR